MAKKTARSILYIEHMRWEPLDIEGSKGLAWIKTLAKDEETGARAAIVKFDPGYQQSKAVSQGAADIYVLEGEMVCGKLVYGPGTYQYRPRGTEFGPIESPKGITRLVFQAGAEEPCSSEPVFIDDVAQLPWQPGYVESYWKTIRDGSKPLREDKLANLSVLIHGIFQPGTHEQNKLQVHDHFEEAFILEGENEAYLDEIEGHHTLKQGLYLWREPNSSGHGDVLNLRMPCVIFIRRGWVGDMQKFHESSAGGGANWFEMPPVAFRE